MTKGMCKIDTPLKRVRSAEVELEPLGKHGLGRKLLGFDPETQHTTNIVYIPKGWRGGGVAHYHHAFEEVYMLEGSVTVGGSHYWKAGDYFYRPAQVVHGHDERSEEGALALIRSDAPLTLLLIHEPAEPDEYPLSPIVDERGHVYSLPVADVAFQADPTLPQGWEAKPLSHDPSNGGRTLMVRIPAGWQGEAPKLGAAWEAYVLEGAVRGTTATYEAGDYTAGFADTPFLGALESVGGATVMLWQFGVAE